MATVNDALDALGRAVSAQRIQQERMRDVSREIAKERDEESRGAGESGTK